VIIGKDGAGSKLCDGNLIGRPIQYATLSHCWGKQFKPTVLTLENKATFQEGLPDTSLPRTFKDAIVAARMLGLDYIWIDSLCIIQNSDDDWMNEVSQMGKVYERSTVTITATSSEDDGGGCFFSRNTQDTFPTRISVEPINGCSRRQKLTGASQTIFDLDIPIKEHWKYDVEMAPVNARGWVLQEVKQLAPKRSVLNTNNTLQRFLSPRLLHFSKRQLYWECNQMLASEAYPSGFCIIGPGQYLEFSPWHGRLRSDLALPLPLDLRGLFRETFIETWMNIIEHYTTRDISKKRDKLPAISALARKVYALRSSDYLAGIWRKDLVYELGWMSFSCNSPSETSEESSIAQSDDRIHYSNSYTSKPLHRAPSWSWASVDGQVTYPYGEYNISSASNHSLLEYVNHRIKLRKNADPYGEITEGHLTVIAQTIEVTLKQYPEFEAGRSTVHQMQISVIGHIVAAQTNVCLDELNGWSYPDSYEGLAMPVLLSLSRSGELFLTCLLLEKEHDSYKRIGALNLRAKRWDLESDYGLQEIVCRLGKIEWDVKPGIHFMRDPSQLQQIKIV
jgi:hypothetical protein